MALLLLVLMWAISNLRPLDSHTPLSLVGSATRRYGTRACTCGSDCSLFLRTGVRSTRT